MKLNRTGSNWDRLERNKINENWDIIEGNHNKLEGEFNDVVGKITDEVVGHLIDTAKLDWKEPVDTVEDLPASAEVGETRMVREADPDGISYVYRYDGENWEKIQEIDVTLVNEVDRRLTAQLADIVINVKYPPAPLQPALGDGNNDDIPIINDIIRYLSDKGGGTVYIPNGVYYGSVSMIVRENIHISGDKHTIIDAKENAGITQIKTPDIASIPLNVSMGIAKGEKVLLIDNNVQPGDFVEIESTELFTSWSTSIIRDYYTCGEIMKVESATPTSITFTEPVSFDFPLEKIRRVRTYTPTKNIKISNVVLTRVYSEIGAGTGINISQTDDFQIENIRTENTNSDGIIILKSRYGVVRNIKGIGGTKELGLNYLVDINNGSKFIDVSNVFGERFRHVVASGGNRLTSMNNTFKDIYAEGSQSHSIDAHANAFNFTYENCFVDNGLSISGKGHHVKNVKSKSGSFLIYEGGEDSVFENIKYEQCSNFRTTQPILNIVFKNVYLMLKNINTYSIHASSKKVTFEGCRIINTQINDVTTVAEADALFPTGGYRGVRMREGYKLIDTTIEGFAVGFTVEGSDCVVKDVTLINCGWRNSFDSGLASVFYILNTGNNARINGITEIYNHPNVSPNGRVFVLGTSNSELICRGVTIQNVRQGAGHTRDHYYGIYIASGLFKELFMQNVRPVVGSGGNNYTEGYTGKFIYNTVIADN